MLELERIDCPGCGSEESAHWASENGFDVVRCSGCDLLFVNPRPTVESVTEANKVGVHKGESAINVRAKRDLGKVGRYGSIIRQMFAEQIRSGSPMNWLDVGAGYGEVIEAVLQVCPPGTTALGIEPMAPKVAKARQLCLPVYDKQLADVDGDFDVISLINVYSHIPDFDGFARMLIGKLKVGGFLFIETGNLAELESRAEFADILYLPDHMVFSGRLQMQQTFRRLGLDLAETHDCAIDTPLWRAKMLVKSFIRRQPAFTKSPTQKELSSFSRL